MNFIVVTGGVASGKSTVVELLKNIGGEGLHVFDCDTAVNTLYQSGRLSRDLVARFGAEALLEDGQVNKSFLREQLINDPAAKASLEEITHPKILDLCRKDKEQAIQSGQVHSYVLEIPLFFDNNIARDLKPDLICVVASSAATQCSRMMQRDNCTEEDALALIDVQMSTQEKIDRADLVIWNDGDEDLLRKQVDIVFKHSLHQAQENINPVPQPININEMRELPYQELQLLADPLSRSGLRSLPRPELIQELCRHYLSRKAEITASGVIEQINGNMLVLRDPKRSFRQLADDVYIGSELMRRYDLRPGNEIKVRLRPARGKNDRYLAAAAVLEIEGVEAEQFQQKPHFDKLTALIPTERLMLEHPKFKAPAMRVIDLITPLGKGQRALVVAPPRGGKTVLLKMIAKSLQLNYPEAELLILLLDERPEEVTDFEDLMKCNVYASTFDEPSQRHAQLSSLVLERARRLVEQGKDVIIMLDSLTRLARGYNANQSGGRIMSGGLGANALEKPRKFFGAARKVEEGGSLTIVATCLIETESRMDEIIFEEFKGTGNMEIRLDRELAERRIYPAISIPQSGTRNDDRLYHPDEMRRILQLRRQLASLPGWEGLEALLKDIHKTQNNAELLLKGLTI